MKKPDKKVIIDAVKNKKKTGGVFSFYLEKILQKTRVLEQEEKILDSELQDFEDDVKTRDINKKIQDL